MTTHKLSYIQHDPDECTYHIFIGEYVNGDDPGKIVFDARYQVGESVGGDPLEWMQAAFPEHMFLGVFKIGDVFGPAILDAVEAEKVAKEKSERSDKRMRAIIIIGAVALIVLFCVGLPFL